MQHQSTGSDACATMKWPRFLGLNPEATADESPLKRAEKQRAEKQRAEKQRAEK